MECVRSSSAITIPRITMELSHQRESEGTTSNDYNPSHREIEIEWQRKVTQKTTIELATTAEGNERRSQIPEDG